MEPTPIHPGEILREDFLKKYNITAKRLADAIGASQSAIENIAAERQSIPITMALYLSRALGTSTQFWANLQFQYDLEIAKSCLNIENIVVLKL